MNPARRFPNRSHSPLLLLTLCGIGLLLEMPMSAQQLPPGFTAETIASHLNAATAIAPTPDGRILITEQTGRVLVWKDGGVLDTPALQIPVTDYWERGLIGLTLHPAFPEIPHLFVCYVTDKPFIHHVVSRWTMNGDTIDPSSEKVLLEGDDQDAFGGFQKAGHQGGALRFGHDGKLYISIGEQTAGDPSQDKAALQGSILRLNPDGSIPEDNPFSSTSTGKYRAIYAWGVRNSFGIAVQPREDGGRIFFTDVGASAFEEINELISGANYGWPKSEGPTDKPGFTPPLHAYPPAVGRSICGGLFYPKFPRFGVGAFPQPYRGQFFFVDWANHWIKFLNPIDPSRTRTFASGLKNPVALELAPDGSLLVLNRNAIWRDPSKFTPNSGSLIRIRYSDTERARANRIERPPAALGIPSRYYELPSKLSELEMFTWFRPVVLGATNTLRVPEALRSYTLNCPPWEPGVRVSRWFALPAGQAIAFAPAGEWSLPPDTVLIQHYARQKPPGRPLETRLIVVGENTQYGASYRWNPDGSDAMLLEDPEFVDLGAQQTWLLAAPEPSLFLPVSSLSYVPHLNTRQLNRPGPHNPVRQWQEAGLLTGVPSDAALAQLPVLSPHTASNATAQQRVRSYLDVNCAICHRPGGNSRGQFDARFDTSLENAALIDAPAAAGDLGIPDARVVFPGAPEKSILYRRLNADDLYRMPPVQYHDQKAPILSLLKEWIESLKPASAPR